MKYIFRFMKKSRIMSILISFQLAVVCAIFVILISAYKDRTVYNSIVNDAISQNGVVVYANAYATAFENEQTVLKQFNKATKVTVSENCIVFTGEKQGSSSTLMCYSDELMKKIPPFLASGAYPKENSDNECLVCEGFGYKVGDVVTLTDDRDKTSTIKVCGIMRDNQLLYGSDGIAGELTVKLDYRDFYINLYSPLLEKPVFLSTENIVNQTGLTKTLCNGQITIINFPNNAYSDAELQSLVNAGGGKTLDMTSVYKTNSNDYVSQQLYILLPIAIAILLITIFTAVTTSIISTMRNLRNYAVLYLCGATWKRCSVINLMNFCVISVVTLILDTAFFIVGKNTYLKDTVVKISAENVLVCVGILFVFLILSAIVPLIVVHNKQPRDVLKTEFRQ